MNLRVALVELEAGAEMLKEGGMRNHTRLTATDSTMKFQNASLMPPLLSSTK